MKPGRTESVAAVTLCVMLATIMQALDTTIAAVALPYMQGSLAATTDQINWVLTSYITAAAITMPVTGFLAARFGRKTLFLTAVAGFTIASAMCGLAQSLSQIVAFRLIQGVFGAPLVPLSQSVLLDSYPRERHGSAMAMWGVGVMVGPILGPALGGWLTQHYDWRWVFFINAPVGLVAFLGLTTFLAETKLEKARLDFLGFAALSLGIGALQMFLDRGQQLDWFASHEIMIEAGLACLGFYLFLVQMFTREDPFIPPALFRDRNFVVGVSFIFIMGVILLATLALLTPYLQDLIGLNALEAGILLAPRGVGTMIAMLIVGRLINHIDSRLLIGFGLALTAAVLWEMTGFTADTTRATIAVAGALQGLGLGFLFVPLATVTFATLPPPLRTQGTALFSLARNIGSSVGISFVIFMLTRNTQSLHAEIAQQVTAFNAPLHQGAAAKFWNLATLAGRAALNSEIVRQAATIAFSDDFLMMTFLALAAIPLVLLLRGAGKGAGAAAALD